MNYNKRTADMIGVELNEPFYVKKAPSEVLPLPYFKKGTMYKNMENNKRYSLKELGL